MKNETDLTTLRQLKDSIDCEIINLKSVPVSQEILESTITLITELEFIYDTITNYLATYDNQRNRN